MNLDSLSFTLSQITYLISTLNKKNYKLNSEQIYQLVASHGFEADRHFLRCLFSYLDLTPEGIKNCKDSLHIQLLSKECTKLLIKPAFISNLCFALNSFNNKYHLKPYPQLLSNLSQILKLNRIQEVVFGLTLLYSDQLDLYCCGLTFAKQKLLDLINSYITGSANSSCLEEGSLQDCSTEILHFILYHLQFQSDKQQTKNLGIAPQVILEFYEYLKKDFTLDLVPIVLKPLIYKTPIENKLNLQIQSLPIMANAMLDSSLAELIIEIGYQFCSSVEECQHQLVTLGVRDITPSATAKVLSMMVRSHTGLDDIMPNSSFWNGTQNSELPIKEKVNSDGPSTWNVEVFVQALKEICPNLSWQEVIKELDHTEFIIKDADGLKLLITALKLGLKNQGYPESNFPVELFYRHWIHGESQITLIHHIIKNPDIFCFIDYPCTKVHHDLFKIPIDEKQNKEYCTWFSLALIDTILSLGDRGLYTQAQEIFKVPGNLCPDVLTLGLIQVNSPFSVFRQNMLKLFLPTFYSPLPNSQLLIQLAWQNNQIKPIVVSTMIEWVTLNNYEPACMSRIVDYIQDLNALHVLLATNSFPFILDLACLAARREFLKLDRWLTDKAQEIGARAFLTDLVKYLQKKCPSLIGKDEMTKGIPFNSETLTTVLNFLQTYVGAVPAELSEVIMTMCSNGNTLLLARKQQQIPSGVLAREQQQRVGLDGRFNHNQLFSQQIDPALSAISSGLSNINLNNAPPSNNAFNLPGGLGPLVSNNTPGSPSRLVASQSPAPFQLQIAANQQGGGAPNFMSGGILSRIGGGVGPQNNTSMNNAMPSNSNYNGGISEPLSAPVSKDIEDEANSYFQRIYNHHPNPTLSIEEVLDMLKKFKESNIKRERDVFNCMLKNLFDEYKFFPQYPDKELQITAHLFGGIIEHGLFSSYVHLGLALRFVLDALRQKFGSKMYFFGIAALDRFKTKLKEYTKYCDHVASTDNFNEFPPHIVEYVEYGRKAQDPPNRPQQPNVPNLVVGNNAFKASQSSTAPSATTTSVISKGITSSVISSRPSIANATNIDTLLVATDDETVKLPPEHMQDKTGFIFNNLSQLNLTTKCDELRGLITEEYFPWLAQYLVMKRASIELNFHVLYSNFLDEIKLPEVLEMVITETFRNIKVLLKSDKGIANFSDRTLLKNLGHWLGMLTLGRNRPIRLRDLDLKSLIAEAYKKGQQELLYVVPFAAKVLESCSRSKTFKCPSPYTMRILNVLAELHSEPELKLNLKFEIEVLCKSLSVDVNQLQASYYLKDPENLKFSELQLSQTVKKAQHQQQQQPPPAAAPIEQQQQQQQVPHSQVSTPIMQQQQPPTQTALQTTPSADVLESFRFTSSNSMGLSNNASWLPVGANSMQMTGPLLNTDDLIAQMNVQSGGGRGTPSSSLQAPSTTPPIATQAPEPRFNLASLNVTNINNVTQLITINAALPLFQAQPNLKSLVRNAFERSVHDWISVVDRSVKMATNVSSQLIKKDFALDPDESRMRSAAHNITRNLTAGMTMITSKDQILTSLKSYLKQSFTSNASNTPKELIDQGVQVVAQENVELAVAFIQKTAIEKAIPEIDKLLAAEFERRKHARTEGRRYCDPQVLTYQAERMPEQIRLKVGGVTQHHMSVYDEFSRHVPGFQSLEREPTLFMPKPDSTPVVPPTLLQAQQNQLSAVFNGATSAGGVDEMGAIYDKLIAETEVFLTAAAARGGGVQNSYLATALHMLMEQLVTLRRTRDAQSALTLIQKAIYNLLEGINQIPSETDLIIRFKEIHLRVLKALQDQRAFGIQWTSKQITKCLIDSREEYKYHLEAVDTLIRAQLLHIGQYEQHLAQSMENGANYVAVTFAMQLVSHYLVEERGAAGVTENDLFNTIEVLARIATSARQPPDGLTALIEVLRANHDQSLLVDKNSAFPPSTSGEVNQVAATTLSSSAITGPCVHIHSGILQVRGVRDYDDPPGLIEKTEYLLREWMAIYHTPTCVKDPNMAFTRFVLQMNSHGILKTDELITRFFRFSTQIVAELTYRSLPDLQLTPTPTRNKMFDTLDAYAKLVSLLIKHSGTEHSNSATKVNLLHKVLGIIAGCLMNDEENRLHDFHQLPYHRIFIMLFLELNAPDPILEAINYHILSAFCSIFHILRPMKHPHFVYAWLEIIGHRTFIGRLLVITPNQKGWPLYAQLLIDMFKFLSPFLRNIELNKPMVNLYKGVLRLLLVLLHDFPEFLCDYHYQFCDVIPANCIQMRNLILSAFPGSMRLPDPFTPNLKVDTLADINQAPKLHADFAAIIQPERFKNDLDSYLSTRSPVTFLAEVRSNVQVSHEPGSRYNTELMNAIVLHVGSEAIKSIRSKNTTPNNKTIAHSAHMDIFLNFAVDLDTEGRYLFLNAIANQLRYPNSHTHYFSCLLLYLFGETNNETIQEQITRVLLERLIVNRPHPWGLLITFIELIKNPTYKFWDHEFVHCAPEIEKLFESVARSCMVQKQSAETPIENEISIPETL